MLTSLGYAQNYFLTYNQLKSVGGSVKKGEKGHLVVYYQKQYPEQSQQEAKAKSVLRYYIVFNIAQCDHLPRNSHYSFENHGFSHMTACDEIIEGMPNCPVIKHSKQKAYYNPVKDYINLPKQGTFATPESYYCAAFHELIHSTGHQSRLNRKEIVTPSDFGSELYSIEELTAEIGACYLNSIAGIIDKEVDNSVAYIKGWSEVLKNDTRLIVYASIRAQKATDYILRVQSYQKEEEVQAEQLETQ